MSGWHCDKCAPGWPLLESRQRGGREYWAGTPFKLSSKSCTNSERITLQAWWRRWWSWRWWCWWWWWEQEDGGGSVLIIWCDIFFQPHWSLYSCRSRRTKAARWSCNPIPRSDESRQCWWKKLGSDLVTFPSPTFHWDPQIRSTLSSKIQIVPSAMSYIQRGLDGRKLEMAIAF